MRLIVLTVFLTGISMCLRAQAQTPIHAVEFEGALKTRPTRYDTAMLGANWRGVEAILRSEENHHDSTASIVMARNGWDECAIVTDWTASMLKHDAMLLRWFAHAENREKAYLFTFFNDGDGRYDDEKVIGQTGGIYHAASQDSAEIWTAIHAATYGGNGGDHRENVVEALLAAQETCPYCTQLVLIADNSAPVRDLSLAKKITMPLHIVLVGVYKEGIHPDYINLAYLTNGSLHTVTEDIGNPSTYVSRGMLDLTGQSYQLNNGLFRKLPEH